MKIFSSSKKKKRITNNNSADNKRDNGSEKKDKKERTKGKMTKKKKVIIILACVLGALLLFVGSAFAIVRWQIQPFFDFFFRPSADDLSSLPVIAATPVPVNPDGPEPDIIIDDDIEDNIEDVVERNINHINFLLFGIDEHANTDVIMLASLNIEENTLNVVSIPRDTMVNVSWNLRKANSIHANMRNRYRNDSNRDERAMDGTIEHFRDIMGFSADYMITVSMNGFIKLIDTIGPVPFNVPVRVTEMGLTIPSGNRNLTGREALAVMRSRRSYANHAIGRDYAQQEFLGAVSRTLLATNWNARKISEMADIFYKNVRTNIPLNYLVGFATDFMKLNSDKINFHMMPGAIDSARGNSYITIQVPEWLELINEHFNPFSRDITIDDVSILTRGPERTLIVTDGKWQGDSTWGGSSLGPRNPSLTTDSSRPIPGRPPPEHTPEADTGGNRNPVTGGDGGGEDPGGGAGGDGGGTGDGETGTGED